MNWLMDKPKFQCLNNYWPTLKINTFLDAFRGCYRPKCWYMSGIYFLFRLVMFIIYTFSTNEVTIRVWQLVFLFLLTVLVAASQPYQVKALNYLDVALLFNLAMVNLVSIYLYRAGISNVYCDVNENYIMVFGFILIWLPMMYFFLYLLWYFLHKCRFYRIAADYVTHQRRQLFVFFNIGSAEERQPLLDPSAGRRMNTRVNEPDPLTDSSMFIRAEETNRYQPSQGVSHTTVSLNNGTTATTSSGIAASTSYTGSSKSSSVHVQVT